MDAALQSFSEIETEKTSVVLLGNMLELGSFTEEEHEKVVDLCLQLKFDKVILVGDNYPKNRKGTIWFSSVFNCAEYLKTNPLTNSTILLKGSRGAKMEGLLDYL
jgi:UDP-N-acetylmuramoyl-tripeptide--D-alanyl-D-alanine ligase